MGDVTTVFITETYHIYLWTNNSVFLKDMWPHVVKAIAWMIDGGPKVACEQAFSRAGWGEGKAKRPVDRPLGPPFHGTRCASDPDASSYWREH